MEKLTRTTALALAEESSRQISFLIAKDRVEIPKQIKASKLYKKGLALQKKKDEIYKQIEALDTEIENIEKYFAQAYNARVDFSYRKDNDRISVRRTYPNIQALSRAAWAAQINSGIEPKKIVSHLIQTFRD
jgi:hypothetical protein